MKFFKFAIAALPCAGAAFMLSAYDIGSGSITAKKFDLHETMTREAKMCLPGDGSFPVNCRTAYPLVPKTVQNDTAAFGSLAYAARWSDDPTRTLQRNASKVKTGALFLTACKKALDNGPGINNAGLLCSSHFGKLQFWHAQKTSDDVDREMTRGKMLDWARFAYRAATNDDFRNKPYCDAVKEMDGVGAPFREAMTFSDNIFCNDRTVRRWIFFRKTYPAWKVGTLFSLQCSNPFQSRNCWERTDEWGDSSAKLAATGALLHMVQDSYSQSHVARVPAGEATPHARGPFEPRIACRPITGFYDYIEQNANTVDANGNIPNDPHAKADKPPELHSSCNDAAPVDDVVTASAKTIWYVKHGNEEEFIDYLEKSVFPLTAG